MFIILLTLALLFVVAVAYWLPRLIVRPFRQTVNLDPGDLGYSFEAIEVKSDEGFPLAGYYVPSVVVPRGNLLLLHGIGGAKESYLEYLPYLLPLGFNLLLLDGRAHGRSGGEYVSFGYHEWRDAVLAAGLLRHLGSELPTGVLGHSMGGAVALTALAHSPGDFDFGIVQSSFAHLGTITNDYAQRITGLPLSRVITDRLLIRAGSLAGFPAESVRPASLARRVRQPVMIIHGEQDRRVNADNGRQLYAALGSQQKELYIIPDADHHDVTETGGDAYWERLRRFLVEAVDNPPS